MSSRYGRNQRRAARQRIAELEFALAAAKAAESTAHAERNAARYKAEHAREIALEEYIAHHDMIKDAMTEIGEELGRALGPQLKPHAEKLMASQRERGRKPFEFSAKVMDREKTVTVLRGEIPGINYNVALF